MRFEEDQLFVSLPPDEFDEKLDGLLDEVDRQYIEGICETIVYCRGELPPAASVCRERLFWFGVIMFFFLGIYGMVSLVSELFGS